MSTSESTLNQLREQLAQGGAESALAKLADDLRAEGRYHELFDALLMRARHRLELPLALATSIDDLPEPTRSQLEEAYLAACKEVGNLLLARGKVREAWMYLRPVGDKAPVAAALENTTPNESNIQELIEIGLHEGVSPVFGYKLVLENYGTCNAISAFESAFMGRAKSDQRAAAGLLVRHLHGELLANLRADIARHDQIEPSAGSISELIAGRDWLFEDNNYHIDTTHLSAAVRIARLTEDPEVLRLAVQLTDYGRRLSQQFQFAGEEPFVETYPAHALFFRASLGEQVDEALSYFRERAERADFDEHGSGPVETYIVLLARCGRYTEAIDASATLIPPGERTAGFAPSLIELSRAAGDYTRMLELSAERGDLIGFAAALVESHMSEEQGTIDSPQRTQRNAEEGVRNNPRFA